MSLLTFLTLLISMKLFKILSSLVEGERKTNDKSTEHTWEGDVGDEKDVAKAIGATIEANTKRLPKVMMLGEKAGKDEKDEKKKKKKKKKRSSSSFFIQFVLYREREREREQSSLINNKMKK